MKFILSILLLTLTSCGRVDTTSVTPIQDKPSYEVTLNNQDKTINELKQERDKLKLEYEGIQSLIKIKELEQVTYWSKWIGYSSLTLATLLLALSFILVTYPLLPTILRYTSYTLYLVGPLALTIPTLYPYLIPIGFVAMAILFGFGALFWFKDRKSLVQVVRAVNETKTHIPNYREKFNKFIDTKSNLHIDHIRSNLK